MRILICLIGLLALPGASRAQEEPPRAPLEDDGAPATAAGARPWSAVLRLSTVYDSNIDRGEEPRDAYGAVAGLLGRYTLRPGPHRVSLEVETAGHRYTNTDRWDRISHRARAGAQLRLGDRWRLGALAEGSRRGSTEDRELADAVVVEPRIEFRPLSSTWVRLAAGHRWKWFEDDPRRDAANPYAELRVRQQLPGGWRIEAGPRYEESETAESRDRYERWTHTIALAGALGRHVTLDVDVRYRDRRYTHRIVEIEDEGAFLRRDRNWVPSVGWRVRLHDGLELQMDYRFESRRSNDPDKAFDAHQITLGTRAVW